MFNKIVFSNYYLRKRRDLKKDGKASNPFFHGECQVISIKHVHFEFSRLALMMI